MQALICFFLVFYVESNADGSFSLVSLPEGSFGLESSYVSSSVHDISLSDVSGDGIDDLMVITSSGVYSLTNDGTGHYHREPVMGLTGELTDLFTLDQLKISDGMVYLWVPGTDNQDVIRYKQIDSDSFKELVVGPLLDYELADIDRDGAQDMVLLDKDKHLWWYLNDGFNGYSSDGAIDLGVRQELVGSDRLNVSMVSDESELMVVSRSRYGLTSPDEVIKPISGSIYGEYEPQYDRSIIRSGWVMLSIPGQGSSSYNFRASHLQGYQTPESMQGGRLPNFHYGYNGRSWQPDVLSLNNKLPLLINQGQGVIYYHFSHWEIH